MIFVAMANEIYVELARNTAFIADGLQFQKRASTEFMQAFC